MVKNGPKCGEFCMLGGFYFTYFYSIFLVELKTRITRCNRFFFSTTDMKFG